jgi:tetratricopeptide (TPR) repeat protein
VRTNMDMDETIRLARRYHLEGHLGHSEHLFRQVLLAQPDNIDVYNDLGNLLLEKGQFDQAVECYEKVIELDPQSAEAHNHLGIIFYDTGEYEKAMTCFQKALQISPFYQAYNNLGLALAGQGQLDDAIDCYRKSIEINPGYADAFYNLGIAFKENGQLDAAITSYRKSIMLDPDYDMTYNNLGNVLKEQGQLAEAKTNYEKAIQLNPDNAIAHVNLAHSLLLSGNLKQGWKEYEWRLKTQGHYRYRFPDPLTKASDLTGLTVLLQAEQGFGDSIQFIRYASMIARKGAKVIAECQKELRSLFKNTAGIHAVLADDARPQRFDLSCPLLSLPFLFDTTLETIPAEVPYMQAEPSLVHKWGNLLQQDKSKLKIGLVWAGRLSHRNDHNRSCLLDVFSPLAHLNDISFFSLQKGEGRAQAKNPPQGMNLIDYTDDIHDFSDTAAIIVNLDLIISADTAAAHLAGALGKPVWTLIPFAPDWRWMLNREDSPWYPTMRLFRQPAPGDWESVMIKVADELRDKAMNVLLQPQ